MTIIRDTSTPERRKFWKHAEEQSAVFDSWPEYKKRWAMFAINLDPKRPTKDVMEDPCTVRDLECSWF